VSSRKDDGTEHTLSRCAHTVWPVAALIPTLDEGEFPRDARDFTWSEGWHDNSAPNLSLTPAQYLSRHFHWDLQEPVG
jgi:hypothetical protein